MKKRAIKKNLFIGLVMISVFVSMPVAVQAQSTRADEARQKLEERREEIKQNAAELKDTAKTRLTEAKLEICQNRQEAIADRMARIADRGEKQLGLFSTIAERVQNFYAEKGNVLSNYDELVADMNAKKAAAETAVQEMKSASMTFDCEGDDPRGIITTFKESFKAEVQVLKEYRMAVRNLIVGVRSVQAVAEPEAERGEQ